jgi:hypothetical protein
MAEENKKEIMDALKAMSDKLQVWADELDIIAGNIDGPYSAALEDIQKSLPDKKLRKKEKKALFIKIVNEKMPEFAKTLNEFDLMVEAIGYRIEQSQDNLQDKIDKLDEIEELQEELDNKKTELNLDG